MFGRNRESRNREGAGRRNWPEAVPMKITRRKKGGLAERSENRDQEQTWAEQTVRIINGATARSAGAPMNLRASQSTLHAASRPEPCG
jgi:hypothetical protein